MIRIQNSNKEQSADIARLIMMAMTIDCCLYFCGDGYGLDDFRNMMTELVEREDSQYSYRNTLVALEKDKVVGISVSYDGGQLRELRRAFIEAAKVYVGKDHTGMDDETQEGECAPQISSSGNCQETASGHQGTSRQIGTPRWPFGRLW